MGGGRGGFFEVFPLMASNCLKNIGLGTTRGSVAGLRRCDWIEAVGGTECPISNGQFSK